MSSVKTRIPSWNFVLDWFERLAVAGLFSWLAFRILARPSLDITDMLLLVSESMVVIFILMRRSSQSFSGRPADWILAFGGTTLPLLVSPGGTALAPTVLCGVLALGGILIQLSAKIILFRSFGIVAANRGVKNKGPYRFVRHPMYAGYMVTWFGFLLHNPTLINATVYACALAAMVGRIMAEERILTQDEAYRQMRSAVPYRLAPGVW